MHLREMICEVGIAFDCIPARIVVRRVQPSEDLEDFIPRGAGDDAGTIENRVNVGCTPIDRHSAASERIYELFGDVRRFARVFDHDGVAIGCKPLGL